MGQSFSPDGQTVVTMSADNYVRAFDVTSGNEKYSRAYGSLWGSNVVFSNDGKLFVCFAQIGKEVITPVAFETETGKEAFRLKHGNGVSEVFFSPDGKFVYSGSRDFTAKKWDLNDTSEPVHIFADASGDPMHLGAVLVADGCVYSTHAAPPRARCGPP